MNRIKLYFKQTSILTISQIINLLLSLGIAILLTKNLSLNDFGIYAFFIAIITLTSIISDLGLNESVAQFIAKIDNNIIHRNIIGNVLFLYACLGVLFSLLILLMSLFIDGIFQIKIGILLAENWWLLFTIPFYELSKAIYRGSGFIAKWAISNILPRLFFLIFLVLFLEKYNISTSISCRLFVISYMLSALINIIFLKPKFKYSRKYLLDTINNIKNFGFYTSVGNFIFNTSSYFDRIFISLFLSSKEMALYQVAITVASPMVMFSRSIGIGKFKNFVNKNSIGKFVSEINFIILVVQCFIIFYILPFVLDYFSLEKYFSIYSILHYILLAHIFLGLKQPYAFFFISKKWGKEIKDISIFTAIISLIAFSFLVPSLKIEGASLGLIVTYFTLWGFHYIYYRKLIKNLY
ncbi:lipopolysaccharide biosynthesis protein [Calditrichota bacterium]